MRTGGRACSCCPDDEEPRQVKVKENQGFWAPIIVRSATKVQQFLSSNTE